MDKKTHDAWCALRHSATPEQFNALRDLQEGFENLSKQSVVTLSTVTEEDRILQKLDVMGEVSFRVAMIGARDMDKAIRARLIELGWLPPEEAEKLRNLRWTQGEVGEE